MVILFGYILILGGAVTEISSIDVAHLLRWLDRYPVLVEVKGGSRPLCAERIWITSNVDPRKWYPELDEETNLALLRRLNITHFN